MASLSPPAPRVKPARTIRLVLAPLPSSPGLVSIAAGNAGIENQEAFQHWYAAHRLTDRAHVFPRLLTLLEQLVGDR